MSRDDKRFLVGTVFLLLCLGVGAAVGSLLVGDWTLLQAYLGVVSVFGGIFALLAAATWVSRKLVP